MHKPNWDDLRYVLAVADAGSVARAAKVLGVNHATVLRRVAEFESRHGVPVFEKTKSGYRVLPDRQDVIAMARQAEAAMEAVSSLVSGQQARLHGVVRVTSTDTLCQRVLPRIAADFREAFDGVSLELLSANNYVDLARLQVDVTVRPSPKLSAELVGQTVAEMGFAVYATSPASQRWLGLSGPLSRSIAAGWMRKNVKAGAIIGGADSFLALRHMAFAMGARTVLPCFLGDQCEELQRLPDAMPRLSVPIWVASHVDFAESPRVRAISHYLGQALGGMSAALAGDLG